MKKHSTLTLSLLAACASTVPAAAGLLPDGAHIRDFAHKAQKSVGNAIIDATGRLFWGAAPAAGKEVRQKITDLQTAAQGVNLDAVSQVLEQTRTPALPFLAVQRKPLYYAVQEATTSWPIIRQQMNLLPPHLMTPPLARWIQQNAGTPEARVILTLNAALESWAQLRELGHSRTALHTRQNLQLFAVESIGRAHISFAAALIEQLRVAPLQRAQAARIAREEAAHADAEAAALAAFVNQADAFVIPAPALDTLFSASDEFPLLPTLITPPPSPVEGARPVQGSDVLKAFLKGYPLPPLLPSLPPVKRVAPNLVVNAIAYQTAQGRPHEEMLRFSPLKSLDGIPMFQSEGASTVFPDSASLPLSSLPVVTRQGPGIAPENAAHAATQTSPLSPDDSPVFGKIITTVTRDEVKVIWGAPYETPMPLQQWRANSQTALTPRR